jgi:DNA uptake protein ComE-like DNA-binding protein
MGRKAKAMNQKQQRIKPERNKVDQASAESFPASDPPSHMGSTAIAGAPKEHPTGKDENQSVVVQERRTVDLNTAKPDEIGSLPALNPALTQTLVANRPFEKWEDIGRLPGFDQAKIDELIKCGAEIGR